MYNSYLFYKINYLLYQSLVAAKVYTKLHNVNTQIQFNNYHCNNQIIEDMERNIIEASKEDRALIEEFMGYPELFLQTFLRWNDIMPVVEKIEGLGFLTSIGHNSTEIYQIHPMNKTKINVFDGYIGNKIQNTYKAVNQFLHWYKTNPK